MDDVALLSRLKIRYAYEEDLPALEWEGEYIHFRPMYREVFVQFMKGNAVMWVAELEDEGIIGQVFVSLISHRPELSDGVKRAYIYGFRVKPKFRSRGVGARILLSVEEDLLARGFQIATLNVAQDNPSARRLYERLGYKVVGIEPGNWSYVDHLGIKHEVHEPAWRMEKKLRSSCFR